MARSNTSTPLSPFVRPHVRAIPPAVHGALNYAELRDWGRHPEDILDFSANINPYGPPPGVKAACAATDVAHYPDPDALRLRGALADHHGVNPAHIVVANGAAELIWLVALAFIRPGDRVLVCAPTYGDYARAVHLMGGHSRDMLGTGEAPLRPPPGRRGTDAGRTQPPPLLSLHAQQPHRPRGVRRPHLAVGEHLSPHPLRRGRSLHQLRARPPLSSGSHTA
ncbi:MAG: aminotransferase class I/II-fold pyridoxal phosphate-dependent enzyme [Ardenticatenia bacterium]|nr:aminotransferase class I/II-fold pyridoxal phosphate-dependent enzyme [Ardenticatenia bacterium]